MKDKLFKCFSIHLFKHLINDGFIPLEQRRDLKNQDVRVWLFHNCDTLQDSIKRYSEIKNMKIK